MGYITTVTKGQFPGLNLPSNFRYQWYGFKIRSHTYFCHPSKAMSPKFSVMDKTMINQPSQLKCPNGGLVYLRVFKKLKLLRELKELF